MKAQLIAVIAVCICITSALFIDPVNSASAVTATIRTNGTITYDATGTQTTVKAIVRHLGNPMPDWRDNIVQHVDDWVAAYPWIKGGAVIIEVGDVAQILWFMQNGWKGHSFNATTGIISNECPWTFAQLKTLIDRLHYNGVSVVLGIIGFAKPASDWSNSDIWGWINETHRELLFTHADGSLYGINNNKYSSPAPLNWFANFTTDDPTSGAKKSQTLYDLFTTRLGQMIDAGLQWDGIFGSEGWGSVGNWGGGTNSEWIDASENAVNQWANSDDKFHPTAFPSDWSSYTLNQKIAWIQKNENADWRGYWGYRYAKDLFANVHDLIQFKRPTQWFIGLIFSPDSTWMADNRAATWSGWSQSVGYNSTWLAKYCSGDTYLYFIDNESAYAGQLSGQAELAKYQAYVAASVKGSDPRFHTIVGIQLCQYSIKNPLWIAKQEWLSQAQDYVWVNGIRYNAVDTSICMIQYPDLENGKLRSNWNDLFSWINTSVNTLKNVNPVFLGPTYFAGYRTWSPGTWDFSYLNYTFAQWTFSDNYANNPSYFNAQMSTLYLPATWYHVQGGSLSGWQNTVLSNFAAGNINVIFTINNWGNCPTNMMGTIAFGAGASEAASLSTFHLTTQTISSSDNQVYVHSTFADNFANNIAAAYANNRYAIIGMSGSYNAYKGTSGYTDISSFTLSEASNMGIYNNPTSGRFMYMCLTSTSIPQQIVNNALYWTSNSPISSSEPMIDYKIFKNTDGTMLITMMNHKDMGYATDTGHPITTTFSFDVTQLGLGNISNYKIFWSSQPSTAVSASSWQNLSVTLADMADILVIQPIA